MFRLEHLPSCVVVVVFPVGLLFSLSLQYPCVLTVPPFQLPSLGCSEKKVKVLVAQSCLTLCDPMDCSPPGSSVHEIL